MALEFQIVVDDKGSAKVKKFSKNVKDSGSKSKMASKALKIFGGSMAVVGASAVVAGKEIFDLVNKTTAQAKELSNLAKVANVSETEFQKLAFGAKSVGVETDKLSDIYKDVNDRVGDFAKTGGGPMADFFEQIGPLVGVTIEDFKELSGPDALQLFSSSLEKANVSQAEMTFYLESMASDTSSLIPLLKDGGKGFDQFGEKALKAGVIMDEELIQNSKIFQGQMATLGAETGAIFNDLVAGVLPEFINLFDDLSKSFETAGPAIEEFSRHAISMIGFVVEELGLMIRGWSLIAKEANDLMSLKIEFEEDPELEKAYAKIKKRQKDQADQEKALEKQRRRDQQAEQSRKLKALALAKSASEKAQKDAVAETKRRRTQAEKDQKNYEASLIKKAEADQKQKDDDLKKASEKAEAIKQINSDLELSLMSESGRSRELAKVAHDERVKQGADEANSRILMERQLTNISAQEEETRLQKRMQTMAQISEGFSQASAVLNNINKIEQNAISERFEKRREEIESTFADEIKGAEGNSEAQARIKEKRDEKLRQMELKKEKAIVQANKKTANIRKGVAMGEAVINGALAVTRAFSDGGPFAGPILAVLAGAVTATQVGLISQQKFFEGGMIQGKNTKLISTNENGTESILNARATSSVGESALNDFNSGRTQDALDQIQSSLTGSTNRNLTLNINGGIVDRRFLNETLIPSLNREIRRR